MTPQKCPVCGSRAVIRGAALTDQEFVLCLNQSCGACGPNQSTEAEAVAAWNRLRYAGEGE